MIFVTVGSQKFQFDRLLIQIDKLLEKNLIEDKVFAQTGYSSYKPKNYDFENFIDNEKFNEYMRKSDIIVTHAGTGSIITALKLQKKVICVPRLSEYKEHVDDHQIDIIKEFTEQNLLVGINDINNLEKAILEINDINLNKYKSNNGNILGLIENFIENIK